MSKIVILTDNVAQIPPDITQRYQIGTIHFSVTINGRSYKDGIDIFPEELYQRMRVEDISPQTSQPSLGEYLNFFKNYLEQDAQALLYISIPASLSGAFSTANSAANLLQQEFPGKKILVFDAGTATIAQGFIAIEAARAAQDGATIDQLLTLVEEEKPKVGFVAMLETLKYLERGGRIGKAAYLVGNMIDIKPIITIDKEGAVAPLGNIRGEKKMLEKLIRCMETQIGDKHPLRAAVMHADNLEKATQLQTMLKERFDLEEVIMTDFTPVMGSHTGPGLLGVGYHLK